MRISGHAPSEKRPPHFPPNAAWTTPGAHAVPVPPGSPLRAELAPELRTIVDAIHTGNDEAAAAAMWAHVSRWSELEIAHS